MNYIRLEKLGRNLLAAASRDAPAACVPSRPTVAVDNGHWSVLGELAFVGQQEPQVGAAQHC